MKPKNRMLILPVVLIAVTLACTINNITISEKPNLELTITAQAVAIQQTTDAQALLQQNNQVQAPPVAAVADTPAAPAATNTPEPTPTPQKPQMINSTLCWLGPGPKYEVVSSLSKGQAVEVIGRGNTDGWIIINNPLYNDPCWVQSFDIQLDASIDVAALKIFYPPPPPTKTPVPPTPTLVP